MPFSDTRKTKHIQRFNNAELKLLDEEVARLKARKGYEKMTRTKILRVALDVYFKLSNQDRDTAHGQAALPPSQRNPK